MDLYWPPIAFINSFEVDIKHSCVNATSIFNSDIKRSACYTGSRLGCVLKYYDTEPFQIPGELYDGKVIISSPEEDYWPIGEKLNPRMVERSRQGVDMDLLRSLVDDHFGESKLNARAFMLVVDGQIVHEKYGEGFSRKSKLLGWSMTKSIINAVCSILLLVQ